MQWISYANYFLVPSNFAIYVAKLFQPSDRISPLKTEFSIFSRYLTQHIQTFFYLPSHENAQFSLFSNSHYRVLCFVCRGKENSDGKHSHKGRYLSIWIYGFCVCRTNKFGIKGEHIWTRIDNNWVMEKRMFFHDNKQINFNVNRVGSWKLYERLLDCWFMMRKCCENIHLWGLCYRDISTGLC